MCQNNGVRRTLWSYNILFYIYIYINRFKLRNELKNAARLYCIHSPKARWISLHILLTYIYIYIYIYFTWNLIGFRRSWRQFIFVSYIYIYVYVHIFICIWFIVQDIYLNQRKNTNYQDITCSANQNLCMNLKYFLPMHQYQVSYAPIPDFLCTITAYRMYHLTLNASLGTFPGLKIVHTHKCISKWTHKYSVEMNRNRIVFTIFRLILNRAEFHLL